MADIKVLHISQVKPTCFQTSAPKRNQNGGLRVDIEYKDPVLQGSTYLLQTPKLRLPFGLGNHGEEGANRFSLAMSLDNFRSDNPVELEFVKGIEAIDEHIKRLATENSKLWFKKGMKYEVIEELYRPSIKYSDDWPPLFKAKLPFWSGKFNCEFYDKNRCKCDSTNLSNNCTCISLIQLTSLWFMDRQFGCTWAVRQVQIFPTIKYDAFLIKDSKEEEQDECIEDDRMDGCEYGDAPDEH